MADKNLRSLRFEITVFFFLFFLLSEGNLIVANQCVPGNTRDNADKLHVGDFWVFRAIFPKTGEKNDSLRRSSARKSRRESRAR